MSHTGSEHPPLYAVIMAGGSGTRFWPLSRRARPKHLLPLFSGVTLVQQAVARAVSVAGLDRVLVVTREDQVGQCREQLQELPPDAFLPEPVGRDTAMALGFAAAYLNRLAPGSAMLALPADHAIEPLKAFVEAVRVGETLIRHDPDCVVTFGIKPDRPATGYGYIEREDESPDVSVPLTAYRVRRFHEKPDAATADRYLQTGRFFWNSGIFLWRVDTFLDLLSTHAPEVAAAARAAAEAWREDREAFVDVYQSAPKTSIDYALMEQIASRTIVVEAPFHWDDLGSWAAVRRHMRPDSDGNVAIGRFVGIDCAGLTVYADEGAVVAAIGVKDLVVVHTRDATLVCRATDEDRLKDLVSRLEELGWDDVL